MKKNTIVAAILVFFAITAARGQTAADTVMVLPFKNTSDKVEFNWVGESFANALPELLVNRGVNVISSTERKIVQHRMGIGLDMVPSLATSMKVAQKGNATLLVVGSYEIPPFLEDQPVKIYVKVQILNVRTGRVVSEDFPEGRKLEFFLEDALGNLQTIHGQLAHAILFRIDKVLYKIDKSFPFTENDFVVAATKIPTRAFESYIKGLVTANAGFRENYFKNALKIFAAESDPRGAIYYDAALELGHLYFNQRKFAEAVESFERVVSAFDACKTAAKVASKASYCSDESFAESSFYIGLIRWQQNNYEQAMAALRPLSEDLRLMSVYNLLGSISVQASRAEKKNEAKSAALLNEGLELLKKASESSPDDVNAKFNYGIALFLAGRLPEAAEQLRGVIALRPTDGDAYYALSKALSGQNDATAAAVDNQARTYLAANNRYANLEKDWVKSKTLSDIAMRVDQPQRRDFLSVVLSRRAATPVAAAVSESENLLAQARNQFKNGNDDDALITLRRVLASEPMSAESYLILGKIYLRRSDLDQAISSFKTAIFWDNRLVDAHVSLGRIFLEKGDCLQVKNYSVSASEIAPENPDALALKRQAERCSK